MSSDDYQPRPLAQRLLVAMSIILLLTIVAAMLIQ